MLPSCLITPAHTENVVAVGSIGTWDREYVHVVIVEVLSGGAPSRTVTATTRHVQNRMSTSLSGILTMTRARSGARG